MSSFSSDAGLIARVLSDPKLKLLSITDKSNTRGIEEMKTYKVEVIADSTGHWCGNGLVFHDVASAETYAKDLFARWTAVREWRVIDAAGNVQEKL